MGNKQTLEFEIPKTIMEKMESWDVGQGQEIIYENVASWQNKRYYFHKKYPDRKIKIWSDGKRTFAGRKS